MKGPKEEPDRTVYIILITIWRTLLAAVIGLIGLGILQALGLVH